MCFFDFQIVLIFDFITQLLNSLGKTRNAHRRRTHVNAGHALPETQRNAKDTYALALTRQFERCEVVHIKDRLCASGLASPTNRNSIILELDPPGSNSVTKAGKIASDLCYAFRRWPTLSSKPQRPDLSARDSGG